MHLEYQSNNTIKLDSKPRATKKITMSRLGAVLGINPFQSPFEAWCDITKVYSKPFITNEYLQAGIVIEELARDWLREDVYCSNNVKSPQDYFGNTWNTVSKQWDFFKDTKIFGGMWDTVVTQPDGVTIKSVIEQKTTKRVEDWNGKVPLYYLVQALGYALMCGAKKCSLMVTFLQDEDYRHPELFVVNSTNTVLFDYDVDTTLIPLPDGFSYTIAECFEKARDWFETHVNGCVSPMWDESNKNDCEVLKEIRTKHVDASTVDLDEEIKRMKEIEDKIEAILIETGLDNLQDELESIKSNIKTKLQEKLVEGIDKVVYDSVSLKRSYRTSVDTTKLKNDGLYNQYVKTSVSYTLTKTKEN